MPHSAALHDKQPLICNNERLPRRRYRLRMIYDSCLCHRAFSAALRARKRPVEGARPLNAMSLPAQTMVEAKRPEPF